jgi:hypothetical protein
MEGTWLDNAVPCGEGTCKTEQAPDIVSLVAEGEHNMGGYEVFLEQSSPWIYPPEYALLDVDPTGPVAAAITPFVAQPSFGAAEPIERVIVRDATGRHEPPAAGA